MIPNTYHPALLFPNTLLNFNTLYRILISDTPNSNNDTQRRSKEIAIRKVNGAEASTILRLLSRDILYFENVWLAGNFLKGTLDGVNVNFTGIR